MTSRSLRAPTLHRVPDIDVLDSILASTAALIDGGRDEQLPLPTPCAESDRSDLACAAGQDVPHTDDELGRALAPAQASVTDGFRGPGKALGPVIDVDDTASSAHRLLGFTGREVGR